jgi:hypothetical protein
MAPAQFDRENERALQRLKAQRGRARPATTSPAPATGALLLVSAPEVFATPQRANAGIFVVLRGAGYQHHRIG